MAANSPAPQHHGIKNRNTTWGNTLTFWGRSLPAGGTSRSGISVSWTTHDLLLRDQDRYGTYRDTHQAMNRALGRVLRAFGYRVMPFGSGGAWLVTGHRKRGTEAGR